MKRMSFGSQATEPGDFYQDFEDTDFRDFRDALENEDAHEIMTKLDHYKELDGL